MGRLRNISASFKAAAFPSASTANGHSRASPESPSSTQAEKETPTIVREGSSNSVPGTSPNRNSVIHTPPTMSAQQNEEIEELKPVFSYLSSHANKLYQEGYFLKLDDLDTNGKPNTNRVWTECFAQLVGTILSFWNAEALDAAGHDGEVAPSFINLADASIKMIETLPTRNTGVQPLQNVLSISTAGKNRYLLHFNSLHSLTQWTAGIRLAMFENASLHELYTGSLIAGKGRHLNSINQIMSKNRFRIEDWARVRFGAGTPWRRCWCVIEPPDEKEWQKSQKRMGKRSAYEKVVYPKGDIKFYDSKKIKKSSLPIATITDAYSAYAIYPQSKFLINESTLVKLEGKITIHSQPESKTEGFVFVMPEVHPAVSGFEMMLRWLLPVYDTFSLYGRPTRLIPDTLDTKSLMFAMPKERRYGYLDIIDIASLIHTEGSDQWTERDWRKKMKEAVARRMSMQVTGRSSNIEQVRNATNPRQGIQFSDGNSVYSNRSGHRRNESSDAVFESPKKTHTAPTHLAHNHHARSSSEHMQFSPQKLHESTSREYRPSRLSTEQNVPDHLDAPTMPHIRQPLKPRVNEAGYADSANSSDSEVHHNHVYAEDVERDMIQHKAVQPVVAPPEFQHSANDQPRKRPMDRPEMRREKSRMSDATLSQMNPKLLDQLRRESETRDAANASSMTNPAASAAAYAWAGAPGPNGNRADHYSGEQGLPIMQGRGVTETPTEICGSLTNTQRTAAVGYPSSTSTRTQAFIKRHSVSTENQRSPLDRNTSETPTYSMNYNDRDSSPDYDSHPEDLPQQKHRVRGGTRKIVGNADTQTTSQESILIDFGYTLRLTPENSRPSTAAGHRSLLDSSGDGSSGGRRSPFDSLGLPSPVAQTCRPNAPHSPARTPEKRSPTDRPTLLRPQSYAWRPQSYVGSQSPDALSAEDFVRQRASMAMQPQGYAAQRSFSSGRVDQLKGDQKSRPATPPSPSPRKSQRKPTSRQSSGNSVDYSAHLSAREQEMVAKMTGGPLLSNVNQKNRTPDPSVGLIGAIEARDQEKENIKKGLQGKMLQAAIDQRYRESRTAHNQQMQQHRRTQSQYMAQSPQQYQTMNPYQQSFQQMQPVQHSYWDVTRSQMQSPQGYQQSMYSMQQQQASRMGNMTEIPDTTTQAGYVSRPLRQRSQSSYSQYGGFYAPQR